MKYALSLVLLSVPVGCAGRGGPDPVAAGAEELRAPRPTPPRTAKTSASGLAWEVLASGPRGPSPTARSVVTVHYAGWAADGTLIDRTHGTPAELQFRAAIPGWQEALSRMKAGDRVRVWVPERLAYGGKAGTPQGDLVFEITLVSFREPVAPPAPPDVAAPPADAQRTPSGLAYKVLVDGGQEARPSAAASVTVHYAGWTTDGKLFDSSWSRGEPATFPLNAVIAGWTEGMQLMSPGDTFRFWIPVELAYQDKPGRPAGMLVFDVQLLQYEEPPPR